MVAVEIKREGLRTWTQGLNERGAHDLVVEVADASLLPGAEALLRNLEEYMISYGLQVEAEETIAYGYWAVKVRDEQPGRFELWEYNSEATEFVPGVGLTLEYWREQHEVCQRYAAEFSSPQPNQLVVTLMVCYRETLLRAYATHLRSTCRVGGSPPTVTMETSDRQPKITSTTSQRHVPILLVTWPYRSVSALIRRTTKPCGSTRKSRGMNPKLLYSNFRELR